MSLRNKLKIGGHTVNLLFADSWKNQGDSYAMWIEEENTIYIRKDLSPTMKFTFLIHEAMHVMNATIDHTLLDSLAEQVGQFLLDNGLAEPIE